MIWPASSKTTSSWKTPRFRCTKTETTATTWMWKRHSMNKPKSWKVSWKSMFFSICFFFFVFPTSRTVFSKLNDPHLSHQLKKECLIYLLTGLEWSQSKRVNVIFQDGLLSKGHPVVSATNKSNQFIIWMTVLVMDAIGKACGCRKHFKKTS